MDNLKFLNLGCGDHYVNGWTNIDFTKTGPDVIEHNLLEGIPFPDNYFDVVYHSHVLEHFSKIDGEKFIKECFRVLKNGGIIRIAIPDLEGIVNNYKKYFDLALNGDEKAYQNYEWIMLEMYDQSVRHRGGGEMKKYLRQENIPNEDFVKSRVGMFYGRFRPKKEVGEKTISSKEKIKIFIKNIAPIHKIKSGFKYIANKLFPLEYINLGKFRLGGEIHQWMYDRLSLSKLLLKNGFKNPKVVRAGESSIHDWKSFNLDTDENGTIYKADSLYMEAVK